MSFLIDTNVLSEPLKPAPSPRVVAWLHGLDEDRAFVSVVTFAEIQQGVAALVEGKRKRQLSEWLRIDLPQRFADRIVMIDESIAIAWGDLMSDCRRRGRSLQVMDGFIAATASVRQLTLATRNLKDFDGLGLDLLDPWQA